MDLNIRNSLFGNVNRSTDSASVSRSNKLNKKYASSFGSMLEEERSVSSVSGSFDQVSFSSRRREADTDDEGFASSLAKQTLNSMPKGASAERVAELKAQVQSGTYQMNSTRIAAKLLGYM